MFGLTKPSDFAKPLIDYTYHRKRNEKENDKLYHRDKKFLVKKDKNSFLDKRMYYSLSIRFLFILHVQQDRPLKLNFIS